MNPTFKPGQRLRVKNKIGTPAIGTECTVGPNGMIEVEEHLKYQRPGITHWVHILWDHNNRATPAYSAGKRMDGNYDPRDFEVVKPQPFMRYHLSNGYCVAFPSNLPERALDSMVYEMRANRAVCGTLFSFADDNDEHPKVIATVSINWDAFK
jgi:hypothetical protein